MPKLASIILSKSILKEDLPQFRPDKIPRVSQHIHNNSKHIDVQYWYKTMPFREHGDI